MSARQYIPFSLKILDIPLIIYPVKDENPLDEAFKTKSEIKQHIIELYSQHKTVLQKGTYHILFVWNLDGHRMTDVWIHNMKNWSDSGPLLECLTFRDLKTCHDAGIASGDSVICLGREEELRRRLEELDDYLDREKYQPEFPAGMQPSDNYE